MPLDGFREGPVEDWVDLLEERAQDRGVELIRHPRTSRATFILGDEDVVGKVRTSKV